MDSSKSSANSLILEQRIKRASRAGLATLLNLTFLPVIGFIWLLIIAKTVDRNEIDHYHVQLGIKINIIAAIALICVSTLMIVSGGLDSVYTWVYVITYFTLVHTLFIVTATWAMVRAWAGQTFKGQKI